MQDVDLKPDTSRSVWFVPLRNDVAADHLHLRVGSRSRVWRPPTDVFETEDAVIVRVEIGGMQNSEFAISLEGQVLTIQGTRPDQPGRRAFHQMEIHFGEFSSQIELHWAIAQDKIEAEYRDGFLRVVLPKQQPHQIVIRE